MALQRVRRLSDGALGTVDNYVTPNSVRELLIDQRFNLMGLQTGDRIVLLDNGLQLTMTNAEFQAQYENA
jgi:hypothetical protein